MSTKFVLIPDDMYRSLINDKRNDQSQLGVNFSKSSLEKIIKSKNKNLTSKNLLYNQELRRYLKANKEETDKPVKVEMVKDKETKIKGVMIRTPENNQERLVLPNLDENDDHTTVSPPASETEWRPADQMNFGTTNQTPISNYYLRPEYTPPSDNRAERILLIMKRNPAAFGLNSRMKVLSYSGKPIINSDVIESVNRILHPNPHDNYSPPGTPLLRKKILDDPVTSSIYNENQKRYPTNKYRRNPRPTTSNQQSGEGIKHKNLKSKSKLIFRPKLWK
jgi:hypothetical protein